MKNFSQQRIGNKKFFRLINCSGVSLFKSLIIFVGTLFGPADLQFLALQELYVQLQMVGVWLVKFYKYSIFLIMPFKFFFIFYTVKKNNR